MINVKNNTQAWSSSAQPSGLKSDNTNFVSADLKKKLGKDEEIGDIANRLTNPNYIDEKKVIKGQGDPDLDKDAFFKLMLTQLKYQDPTNPLESHEMAAQLAQFSSLEKLSNIGESLDALKKGQEPSTNFQSLNLIGKSIRSDSSKLLRSEGDKNHDISFNLKGDSVAAKIAIMDSKGKEIRSLEVKNLSKGEHLVKWDGKTNDGLPARAGDYAILIEARNSNNQKVQVDTQIEGLIEGVNFTPSGPVLMVGDQTVRLSDVKKIWDASKANTNKAAAVTPLESNTNKSNVDLAKQIPSPNQALVGQSDLNEVPMDAQLRSKLEEQVAKQPQKQAL